VPRRLHPSRWGVRTRSALAAALVVALAMLIAAAALLWLLKSSLESSSDSAAGTRAEDISRQLVDDAPTELASVLLATDDRSTLIQVVDAGGHVVAASPGAPPDPLTAVRAAAGQQRQLGRMDVVDEAGDYRVTARGVAGPVGELTVLVAEGQQTTETTLSILALLLIAGIPLLVLVVGAATYALVGRSLCSVERIRTRVAAITSADLVAQSLSFVYPPGRCRNSRSQENHSDVTDNRGLTRFRKAAHAPRLVLACSSAARSSALAAAYSASACRGAARSPRRGGRFLRCGDLDRRGVGDTA